MSIGWWSPFCGEFTEEAVLARVPSRPGVYILFVKMSPGGWRMDHLGKAEDMRADLLRRLAHPDRRKSAAPVSARGFTWMEVSTEVERSGVAKFVALVLAGDAHGAGGEPDGEPIRVALPPFPAQPTPRPYL